MNHLQINDSLSPPGVVYLMSSGQCYSPKIVSLLYVPVQQWTVTHYVRNCPAFQTGFTLSPMASGVAMTLNLKSPNKGKI